MSINNVKENGDSSTNIWILDRYARYIKTASGAEGHWEHYDDSTKPLCLALTNHQQLVLSQGTIVLEMFNLVMNGSTLRGLAKTDSLLIMYRNKDQTRRSRMRFKPQTSKSGTQVCENCAKELSRFFIIKQNVAPTNGITTALVEESNPSTSITPAVTATTTTTTTTQPNLKIQDQCGNSDNMMEVGMSQEIMIGQMAQSILTDGQLGLAYRTDTLQTNDLGPDSLPQLVRLCLLDPTFPSFVARVEQAIHSATQPNA